MSADHVQVAWGEAVLTEAERVLAQQVALRLRSEFSNLISAMPVSMRSALGLSRALGVSRPICHRLLTALQEREDDLKFLTLVPGVEGLRQCAAKLRQRLPDFDEALVSAADGAIDAFHELIRKVSGSHSRLCARVQATQQAHVAPHPVEWTSRQLAIRRNLHAAAAAVMGRKMGLRVSIAIVRPIPGRPEEIEYAHVRGYLRQQARPGAVPLVVGSELWSTDPPDDSGMFAPKYCSLDGAPLVGRSAMPIITGFSGQPLPIVTTRDGTGRLTHVIDTREEGVRADGTIPDLVLAYRLPSLGLHPARQSPPVHAELLRVQDAMERMVFDVYLHHSMAAMATPSMNLYTGHRMVHCDLTDRWFDRLEGSPLLTLLGRGIGNAHSEAWERHAELTRYVFDALGWPPSDFVGFRCDEAYPMWGCDYVMGFEYPQVGTSGDAAV